jgi:hypothetical protein
MKTRIAVLGVSVALMAPLIAASCSKAADEAADAVVRKAAIGTWHCAEDHRGEDGAFDVRITPRTFTVSMPSEVGSAFELPGTWAVEDGVLRIRTNRSDATTFGLDVPDADHLSLDSKHIEVIQAIEASAGGPTATDDGDPDSTDRPAPDDEDGRPPSSGIDLTIEGRTKISFLLVRERDANGVTYDADKDDPRNPWTCTKS